MRVEKGLAFFFVAVVVFSGLVFGSTYDVNGVDVEITGCLNPTTCHDGNNYYSHSEGQEDYSLLTDSAQIEALNTQTSFDYPTTPDINGDGVSDILSPPNSSPSPSDLPAATPPGELEECEEPPKELNGQTRDETHTAGESESNVTEGKEHEMSEDEFDAAKEGKDEPNEVACRFNDMFGGEDGPKKGADIARGIELMESFDSDRRNEIWESDLLGDEAKKNFMNELGKQMGLENGIDLGDKGKDYEGKWSGEAGEAMDFTPEGFSEPIGLPFVDEWNEDIKDRKYKLAGRDRTDKAQKLEGISLKDGVLSYDFSGTRQVNINEKSGAHYDVENGVFRTKDDIGYAVYGDGKVNAGKDGSVVLPNEFSEESKQPMAAKLLPVDSDNKVIPNAAISNSFWHVKGAKPGAAVPTTKGKFNYWVDPTTKKVRMVDSDGIVRESRGDVTIFPADEKKPVRVRDGYVNSPGGDFFPSSDSSGTPIYMDHFYDNRMIIASGDDDSSSSRPDRPELPTIGVGSPGTGAGTSVTNMFSWDGISRNVQIASNGEAWFTQRDDVDDVKLSGDVTWMNGDLLARTKRHDEGDMSPPGEGGAMVGDLFFRKAANQDDIPMHSVGSFNGDWVVGQENGQFQMKHKESGRVFLTEGDLQSLGQRPGAPGTPGSNPGTPGGTPGTPGGTPGTPGTTTPGTSTIPGSGTPGTTTPGTTTTPPVQPNYPYTVTNSQVSIGGGSYGLKSGPVQAYGVSVPNDIPKGALVMVSSPDTCGPCRSLLSSGSLSGLKPGYNSAQNIYYIKQNSNAGGVPRFYQK